jgi:pimeloyl-ACP methyl ester carboxylesterase
MTTGADNNIRKPYFQIYSKNDGLAKIKPVDRVPPYGRPIVFVHGFGGLPSDFYDYIDTFRNSGWDSRYLLSFDYGLKEGRYNNFAPIDEELSRLSTAVSTVSALYRTDGGDGKVSLVGYSSGALLVRNFLGTNRASHHVKDFISIAGNFRGSFLADLEASNDAYPRSAAEASAKLAKIFTPNITSINPLSYGRIPQDNAFRKQITSVSPQVSRFKINDLPEDVRYCNLQGDITVLSTQRLFKSLVKSVGSLGDGAVLGSSASDLPGVSSYSFLDNAVATRSVIRSGATVSAGFTLPDLSSLRFFHSNLLKALEIRNKILELLK